MAMGTVTSLNVRTSGAMGVQFQEKCDFTQISTAALTTALDAADIIVGPSIPANCSLVDVTVDVTDIDSATGVLFTVGITGTTAKFISSSSVGQTGGIARMNVAGALGYTPTADTPVIVTVTVVATTPVAGTMKIGVRCTANA